MFWKFLLFIFPFLDTVWNMDRDTLGAKVSATDVAADWHADNLCHNVTDQCHTDVTKHLTDTQQLANNQPYLPPMLSLGNNNYRQMAFS